MTIEGKLKEWNKKTISKSDIVSCFDLVIRAVVKRFALSSKEQLTHDGNETIEHGFYRSEQMSLFSINE